MYVRVCVCVYCTSACGLLEWSQCCSLCCEWWKDRHYGGPIWGVQVWHQPQGRSKWKNITAISLCDSSQSLSDGDKDMFCMCANCVYLSVCMHCILSIREMLHVYIQVCTYMHVCVYIVHMHVCAYIVHTYACVCITLYICMCVHNIVHMHVCT